MPQGKSTSSDGFWAVQISVGRDILHIDVADDVARDVSGDVAGDAAGDVADDPLVVKERNQHILSQGMVVTQQEQDTISPLKVLREVYSKGDEIHSIQPLSKFIGHDVSESCEQSLWQPTVAGYHWFFLA